MLTRSLMGLVLMRIVASCGTAAVAAYGIVLRFNMILLLPAFAVGNSSAALVGQNLGANRPGRAARTVWIACGLEVGLMAVSAAALWTFGPGLVGVFSRDPRVIEVGARFLRIAAPSFVFAALAIVMGRSMQGAGDAVPPMLSTIVSLWGLQVPLAVALSRVWNPPTDGIWWAHAIATVSNGLMNAAWFMTGRWQHKRV
jgi:Na+-driven multidrug efflux pump